MRFGKYGRNPMWAVIGLLAVIYGVGIAFGDALWGENSAGPWMGIGAAILGILFVVFMVIPFVRWMLKGTPETR